MIPAVHCTMTREIIDVWNEVTISPSGIGITLYSEKRGGPAIVEDETWFTFDEMEEMGASKPQSLNLSDETRAALVGDPAPTGEDPDGTIDVASPRAEKTTDTHDLPDYGAIVEDKNPPSWGEGEPLRVVNDPNMTAGEYVIEESLVGHDKTVADANPSADPDEPVVECAYMSDVDIAFDKIDISEDDVYAFPVSRLEW